MIRVGDIMGIMGTIKYIGWMSLVHWGDVQYIGGIP